LELFQLGQNAGMNLSPLVAFHALQNVDALFQGEGVPLPDTVILDYLYGIAAYKAWRSIDGLNQMEGYRDQHYVNIPPIPSAPPDAADDTDATSVPDDDNDPDYVPTAGPTGLEETMDELNLVLMFLHGITPEMAAERRQKEIEREEGLAQEASRSKVMEWRTSTEMYSLLLPAYCFVRSVCTV
jgi:hypothetical protein